MTAKPSIDIRQGSISLIETLLGKKRLNQRQRAILLLLSVEDSIEMVRAFSMAWEAGLNEGRTKHKT